jgi:hypothetical protein
VLWMLRAQLLPPNQTLLMPRLLQVGVAAATLVGRRQAAPAALLQHSRRPAAAHA